VLKQKNLSIFKHTQSSLRVTEKRCLTNFGFIADPNTTLRKNFDTVIQKAPSHLFLQPKNLTFHNLCKVNNLPPGSKELLGLNLKFCLASKNIPDDINKTMIQLARSIRTRHFLLQHGGLNNTIYEKQIYKKNLTWNPPPAPALIEDKLVELEKALRHSQQKLERKNASRQITNITPLQAKALASLQKNKNIVIKPTDKNLGPAVMDVTEYINQILTEHLLTDTYLQLTEGEAKHKLNVIKDTLKSLLANNANNLSKSELLFFKRSLQEHHRMPIFYGLPKVHKQPVTLRPVVSTSGSLLAIFSTWLDYRMKELLTLVQSHVKNSFTALTELKNLYIPDNALLFAADATSMYTNIEIDIGMSAIRHFLEHNKARIPKDFPTEFFLETLHLVMQNNVFSFANTFWLQLTGTAMGTPAACAYATLTFGDYENSLILQKYKHQLLYYKRYIDDIVGVWLPSSENDSITWENFKKDLNNWGSLRWKIENPSKKTVFLDLELSIQDNAITTKTYQKDMNLYLYIPPLSAHPPSCFKGLITGEVRRYWLQNNPEDFKTLLLKFIGRLLSRGHTLQDISPLLQNAAATLDDKAINFRAKPKDPDNIIFIHKTFHPYGIQRKDIRRHFQTILEPHLNGEKMTVAISRPTNLRDILTKAKLKLSDDIDVDKLVQQRKANVNNS
jgi:hypothetical protein